MSISRFKKKPRQVKEFLGASQWALEVSEQGYDFYREYYWDEQTQDFEEGKWVQV